MQLHMPRERAGLGARYSPAVRHVTVIGVFLLLACTIYAQDWKEEKGRHFIVCYMENEERAKGIAVRAETYYTDIMDELGFKRYDEFWLWEKRVHIKVYPDTQAFQLATGSPKWAIGEADYANRTISGAADEKEFLDTLLPHEMTHLMLRDFMGFGIEIPLWLDEGVATWIAKDRRKDAMPMCVRMMKAHCLVPVIQLVVMNVGQETTTDRAKQFYAESTSLVDYLMTSFGSERFDVFCRALRDGTKTEDCLKKAYGSDCATFSQLETGWLQWLTQSSGSTSSGSPASTR